MILQRLWSDFPSGELLAVSGGSVQFHCVQDTHDQQGGKGILHSKGEADKWLGFLAAFTWTPCYTALMSFTMVLTTGTCS
jgi:hypothetical protein